MEILSVICLKTNQKVYDYSIENGYEQIAINRAVKRFNSDKYRLTFSTDFDHTYNREIDEGYEIVGSHNEVTTSNEYCGQTEY